MPVILRSVLLVGGDREPSGACDALRCDACGTGLSRRTSVVRVRNRTGPAAIRPARLCAGCLGAIDRAIDLTDDDAEIDRAEATG